MEASAYYQQFERNIDIIFDALQVGLNLRTTALATSLPIEIYVLCEVLNQGGAEYRLTSEGVARVAEFMEQFQPRKAETQALMARLLQDQRAVMRTPEGRVLTKEMLIRRLEFFNEAARQMNVMRTQQALGSPDQHKSGIGAALQK